jgi:hypothetical protein
MKRSPSITSPGGLDSLVTRPGSHAGTDPLAPLLSTQGKPPVLSSLPLKRDLVSILGADRVSPDSAHGLELLNLDATGDNWGYRGLAWRGSSLDCGYPGEKGSAREGNVLEVGPYSQSPIDKARGAVGSNLVQRTVASQLVDLEATGDNRGYRGLGWQGSSVTGGYPGERGSAKDGNVLEVGPYSQSPIDEAHSAVGSNLVQRERTVVKRGRDFLIEVRGENR